MRNVVKTNRLERTDPKTGEVISTLDTVEVVKVEVEPFFFTYSKEIMALYGKSVFNATTKVLWKLLELAEYNTGRVNMNSDRRRDIMYECKISRASFDRAIKELIDVEIIYKEGNSTYYIAKNMFWKGDRKTRERLMKNAHLGIKFYPVYSEELDDLEEGAN